MTRHPIQKSQVFSQQPTETEVEATTEENLPMVKFPSIRNAKIAPAPTPSVLVLGLASDVESLEDFELGTRLAKRPSQQRNRSKRGS